MKKILTLLFAVVTVAAFAAPQQPMLKQKMQQQHAKAVVEKAQMGERVNMLKDTKAYTDPIDTLYYPPVGSFFIAPFVSATGGYSGYSAMLIPGGLDLTWRNLTTGYDGTYTWWWYDAVLDPDYYSESTDTELVTSWRNDGGYWNAPRLYLGEVTTGQETYYQQEAGVQHGGKMELDPYEDGSLLTTMNQFYAWDANRDFQWLGCVGAGTDADQINFWESWIPAMQGYGELDSAIDYAKIVRYVQLFDYPGKPYSFSRIELLARANAQKGDVLTAKVCRVEDHTIQMDTPIAEATYVFPASITTDESCVVQFYFEKYDPDLDLTMEDWITVDGDMCIVIEGADKLSQFYPLNSGILREVYRLHPELSEEHAYCEWEFYSNGELFDDAFWPAGAGYVWGDQDQEDVYYLPDYFQLSINAQFAFIEDDETAAVEETIPAEGGTFTFTVRASEPYDAWTAENMPEGVEVTAQDMFDEESGEYACVTNLTVTVASNTNATVVYTLPGTEFKLIIGDGGGSTVVPGDVDGDGHVTAGDITLLYNVMLNNDYTGVVNGDQDGDGNITAGDVTFIYNILLGTN